MDFVDIVDLKQEEFLKGHLREKILKYQTKYNLFVNLTLMIFNITRQLYQLSRYVRKFSSISFNKILIRFNVFYLAAASRYNRPRLHQTIFFSFVVYLDDVMFYALASIKCFDAPT